MPPHTTYCEVFCGGASVFWNKPRAQNNIINDLNGNLVNLYRVIRDERESFFEKIQWLSYSVEEFHRLKVLDQEDNIDRAIAFYYCTKLSMNGNGQSIGRAAVSGKKWNVKYIIQNLLDINQILQGVIIDNTDFETCISAYDGPDVFFYCDPPYFVSSKEGHYKKNFKLDDHKRFADYIKGIQGKFMISYDLPARELFEGYNIIEIDIMYTAEYNTYAGTKTITQNKELLITNYDCGGQTRLNI